MIWLAALTSALSLQGIEPATAECALDWEQTRQRWEPSFTCPQDAPQADALQRAADAVIDRSRARIETYYVRDGRAIPFELTEQGWDLREVTPLYRAPPSFPVQAMEQGVAANCHGTVELRDNGRRRRDDWICRTTDETGNGWSARRFSHASSEAAGESYWLRPNQIDGPVCVTLNYQYNTELPDGSRISAPDFPASEGPQCPD